MVSLDEGEFIYNADGELFLVLVEERDDSYLFAAHGWQEIDKERLDEYLDDDQMAMYTEDIVTEAIGKEGSEEQRRSMEMLRSKFYELYNEQELPDTGPHEHFCLDDTNSA